MAENPHWIDLRTYGLFVGHDLDLSIESIEEDPRRLKPRQFDWPRSHELEAGPRGTDYEEATVDRVRDRQLLFAGGIGVGQRLAWSTNGDERTIDHYNV